MTLIPAPPPIADIQHIIQLAVAPVFLLSGVGVMLSLFTSRLARIVDRARLMERSAGEYPDQDDLERQLAVLARRARYINNSIALSTISGLLVTGTVVLLFTNALLDLNLDTVIAVVFAAAMLALAAALLQFLHEVRYATVNLRIGVRRPAQRAGDKADYTGMRKAAQAVGQQAGPEGGLKRFGDRDRKADPMPDPKG